jgi:hypothetical protein
MAPHQHINGSSFLIDCRCEDGRFLLSSRSVTLLISLSVSSIQPEVGNGIKILKAHVLSLAERQEAVGGLKFRKK